MSRIIIIERGPWDIDLDCVQQVTQGKDSNGVEFVTVATSKGGFVLSPEEAAPIIADQADSDGSALDAQPGESNVPATANVQDLSPSIPDGQSADAQD